MKRKFKNSYHLATTKLFAFNTFQNLFEYIIVIFHINFFLYLLLYNRKNIFNVKKKNSLRNGFLLYSCNLKPAVIGLGSFVI